jgi:hypothetical protein
MKWELKAENESIGEIKHERRTQIRHKRNDQHCGKRSAEKNTFNL